MRRRIVTEEQFKEGYWLNIRGEIIRCRWQNWAKNADGTYSVDMPSVAGQHTIEIADGTGGRIDFPESAQLAKAR